MSWPLSRPSLDPRSPPNLMATRKCLGLRRRLSLLVSLCMLWIYYRIGQWTRSYASSGTTFDRVEETFTTSTRNEAPVRNSHPTIFGDVSDPSPSRTVAVVLPVTSSTLPHLPETLSGLSTIPYLGKIHLVCPENVTDAARNVLRQTLPPHNEFFVTLWKHEWSEAESTLRVASSITSDDVLILSQDALASIDSVSRNMLLSGPPSLPVPVGLRGSEVSCEPKYQGFLTAHFVVPPLLLPPRLWTTKESYFHVTSWQELGAYFMRVEGVGGVVPPGTPGNTSSCRPLDSSEAASLRLEHSNHPSNSSESNDLLVILVAEIGDIPELSKLACEFKSRGKEVEVIAYTAPSDPLEPSGPAGEGCEITHTQVHNLQDPMLYQLLGRSPDVVLTLTEYLLPPSSPLEANTGVTVIRISRRDLPHCDWIASLGVRELRSEHLLKFCFGEI